MTGGQRSEVRDQRSGQRLVTESFSYSMLPAPCSVLCGRGAAASEIPRIGYLSGSLPVPITRPGIEAFQQGLRELGYIEGKNIAIEMRFGEGKRDRGHALAAELALSKWTSSFGRLGRYGRR